jgi:uncharacterized repeat protein (TIGR02543 family)
MLLALTVVAVFFTGCPTGSSSSSSSSSSDDNKTGGDDNKTGGDDSKTGGDDNKTGSDDNKTSVLFKNTGSYAADVYSDSGRSSKIATVPAGGELKQEWTANPDGSSFYLMYQIPLGDGVTIPYNPPPIGPVRIDEGKTTTIPIGNPVSSPDLLTNEVYLLLYNRSNSASFRLVGQGGTILDPKKIFDASGETSASGNSNLVNKGERAWYIVNAAAVDSYYISTGGEQTLFPASVTEFQEGRWYTFYYESNALALQSEQMLNLESLLARKYTVTFNANGGAPATQIQTVNSGTSAGSAMPSNPTRDGYTFGGWYTAVNGGGTQFTATTAVTGDITVYAKWGLGVTFDADGGEPGTQTQTVNSGYSVGTAMPSNPTRGGYTFGGWYTQQNGEGSQFTASTVITGNITVYALWRHTVTFDADGGSFTGESTTQTRTVNSGDLAGAASAITDITYSSVSGGEWTLLSDGRRQSPAISNTGETKSRVSFTSNVANASITIQLDVSSYSYNYAFISQLDNTSASTSGSVISGTQTVSVTIPVPTAGSHFIDIGYQKNYSYSSGFDCAWFKVAETGVSGMPSNPTRSEYSFGGWYTQQNGNGSQVTADTPVTGNITVYALWLPPVYAVQISLRPTTDDLTLSNTALSVNESAQFSTGSGYSSYQWYWGGVAISGANSSIYTLDAYSKATGIYELSVFVSGSTGEILSARCRVTIKAN